MTLWYFKIKFMPRMLLGSLAALLLASFGPAGSCEDSQGMATTTTQSQSDQAAGKDGNAQATNGAEQQGGGTMSGADKGASADASTTPNAGQTEVNPAAVPAGTEASAASQAPPAKPVKPAETSPPPGFDAAVKLYSARKFALAAKEFEKFINTGHGDEKIHAYLAYCLYNTRMYSKALKQFDWVVKNAKSISLQRSAENSAHTIRCYMSGVCPANCLKANDPRWQHRDVNGHPSSEAWITFALPGGRCAYSEHHIGDVIEYVNGQWVDRGKCPTCGGTGRVPPLKDGQPLPH